MKTIAIGDCHGRSFWKLITQIEKDADEIVFLGDYFDSRDGFTGVEQIHNFKEILEYKESTEKKVTLLIGNHIL